MSLFNTIAADAAVILAEAGRELSFRGQTVKAMIGEQTLGFNLENGGMVADGTLSVKLLAASYSGANAPKDGEYFTYNGRRYQIVTVSYRPPSAWHICTATPVNG